MCGICGFTGGNDEVSLRRMADAIIHRGPDEDGFFISENISLGMRRLSIIDLSTGHQPVHNEDKRIWAVFNGEIYNYPEIREELESKGHRFYTHHSDTECIVHLYEEHGTDFVHHINGMFAIALWDQNEGSLFLIRDRMGVKPLYYANVKGEVIFASEIKSILRHPSYRRGMNREAVFHYFSFKHVPAPMTAFEGIYALSAGEILTHKNGMVSKRRWWKIRFNEKTDYQEEEIAHTITALLDDATRLRMRSDVPFGAYLSGGVDSSSVVALMARYSKQPIKTFSLGYEDELKNKEADLHYARKVAQAYGTEHYEYIMSHGELIEEISAILGAFDQPFSGTISTYFLSKLIKKHVKVALSGDGADELFGSYLSHRTATPITHYARLLSKIRSGAITSDERSLMKPCDIAYLEKLYEKTGGREVDWRYQLMLFSDSEKRSLLSDSFMAQLGNVSTFDLLRHYFAHLTAKDPLNRMLEMEWNTIFPDQVLAFVDHLSMAHSIEVRSPFLDYRLVEFVATLPGDLKIKNGIVKDILKRSVEPLLPAGITTRPKEGFVLPIFDWMTDKLKGYCSEVLTATRLNRHQIFKTDSVLLLLRLYLEGDRSLAGKVWNTMMFQIWWEKYFA